MASFSDGAQWPSENAKLQPVQITLEIVYDVSRAAATDDLVHSINYSEICKTLTAIAASKTFMSLESLCDRLLAVVFEAHDQVQDITAHVVRTRALLHPATTGIRASRTREQELHTSEHLLLSNLEYRTIIGINDCEREDTQLVKFDVSLHRTVQRDAPFYFRDLERQIYSVCP